MRVGEISKLWYTFQMFSTSVGPEWSLYIGYPCCPRSQKPAGVNKLHSYLLNLAGSPGRRIPGWGYIVFRGNFPAHSYIFKFQPF